MRYIIVLICYNFRIKKYFTTKADLESKITISRLSDFMREFLIIWFKADIFILVQYKTDK